MALESLPWPRLIRWLGASLAEAWSEWNAAIPSVLSAVLGLCFLAGTVLHFRLSAYRVSPVIPALLWPEILLCFQATAPFSRVWLYLLPLYLGTASAGVFALFSLWRARESVRRIVFACVALAAAGGLGARVVAHSRRHFEEGARLDLVCDFLAPRLLTGDFVGAHGYPATPIAYYLVARDVTLDRVSTEWKLEVLRVVRGSGSASPEPSPRPPRAFFVIRSDDAETLHILRQRARSAGVVSHLRRLRTFGDTAIYEEPEVS
jgi:hypothetical protein